MSRLYEGKPTEKVILSVEAEVINDPEYSRGTMHMRFQNTYVGIKQGEKLVGEICGCLGGGVEVTDKKSDKSYYISAGSIWEAFVNRKTKED